MGLIPGQGTKIPCAVGRLSPCATTTELMHLNERARVPQTTEPMLSGACTPQQSVCATLKVPARLNEDQCAATNTP